MSSMNKVENKLYQGMARYLRSRTDGGCSEGWPGKPYLAPAMTRYPNILAEVCAVNGYPNIDYPAEYAGVSREIIAAVIEDNEELSGPELRRLARRWGRGPVGYLAAPVLQIIDSRTNKGKARRRFLSDLLEDTANMADEYTRRYVDRVLEAMGSGNVITYAQWSAACRELWQAQYFGRQEKLRDSVRRARRVTKKEVPA